MLVSIPYITLSFKLEIRQHIFYTYIDPKRFDGTRAAFVDCQAMGKINYFIFSTMNHKYWRCHLGDLIDTATVQTTITLTLDIRCLLPSGIWHHAVWQTGTLNNGAAHSRHQTTHCRIPRDSNPHLSIISIGTRQNNYHSI
jgi:hypothetical protein